MASHDLRAPLGVAIGYLDVLKEDLQPLTPFRLCRKITFPFCSMLELM
jgi:K+-sensing histidine kinase KdpD